MYDSYRIESGDTIASVAEKFDISIDDLFRVNSWSSISLQDGEIINIPYNKNNYLDKYTVVKGDTLYNLANKYNISKEDLALMNGLEMDEYLGVGQVISVPKNGVGIYVTREGDDIKMIINNLNRDPREIFMLNDSIRVLPDQMIIYRKN